jgi:hypothetical protein
MKRAAIVMRPRMDLAADRQQHDDERYQAPGTVA